MTGERTDKVIAVIPARYASQRLPGKPLAEIGGKPMIQHVCERSAKARLVDMVLVATDDVRIAAAVRGFGGQAVMTPEDCRSGTDRIAFVARSLPDGALIVNVQGDEPLLDPRMIDQAVQLLLDNDTLPVGTLVRKIDSQGDLSNPNIVKVALGCEDRCLYFSRSVIPYGRDRAPDAWVHGHVYYKHVGLYVFRREFLLRYAQMPQTPLELMEKLEQLRILEHGYPIRAAVTEFESIPVDTAADLERVRALVSRQ